ncbi:MAG: hypothetical protein L6R39_004907, partial [Caloplaca ligustica]
MAPFAEVTAIDSHTYLADFPVECKVPHGGFVTSCFLSATALHFATTHAARNQPHTITLHLTFLRRTSVGNATFTIRDVKLGRRTSTVHVSLTQDGNNNNGGEPSVVGYLTQSNLHTESGLSLPTHWSLHPPPPPPPAFRSLTASIGTKIDDGDENWIRAPPLHPKFRHAANRVTTYVPRAGQLRPGMADEWICFAHPGQRFTQASLGYVVDQFPQIVEIYPGTADPPPPPPPASVRSIEKDEKEEKPNWYPTILLNLDVKKALPEEGAEWLFVRVRAKKIENGRMDLEVVVLDEGGGLVA